MLKPHDIAARVFCVRRASLRAMRVKVECGPPLPPLKAWFVVPAVSTVLDLKGALCLDIPALRDRDLATNDFTLVLDGFELLDASSIEAVRDGDLIT